MKLDPDCTRAILLAVEDVCDITHHFVSSKDFLKIGGNFSYEEIDYHARQCDMAGMFAGYKRPVTGGWEVADLTPKAHEFLANIRADTVWNHTKAVAAKVGSKSLYALTQIASAVVTEIIKAQIGLPSVPFSPTK